MKRNGLTKITGKKINNPFIKEKSNKRFKKRCIFCLIFSLLFAFSLIYLLFFTRIFLIKNIKIDGLTRVSKEEVEKIVKEQLDTKNVGIFPEKNIIVFSKKKLIKSLNSYNFSKIIIKKGLFSSIKIEIEEREIAYILKESGSFYYLDKEANIISEQKICIENIEEQPLDYVENINAEEISTSTENTVNSDEQTRKCQIAEEDFLKDKYYPLIESLDQRVDLERKYAKISKEYLNFATRLYNDLGIESDFRVKNFIIDESKDTIKIRLFNDVLVFFSLKDDYEVQRGRFLVLRDQYLLKNDHKNALNELEYIDIRYGDKIYYK